MKNWWSRRAVLAALGISLMVGVSGFVQPAAAQGTLAKVKAAGVLKVAIADNIPWSKLNPDGTVTGLAPLQVAAVAKKLGIPKVEWIVAGYADLIPGLLAGRWDVVGAALDITEQRCPHVLFGDPFYRFDNGNYIGYLPGTVTTMPKTYQDIAKQFDTIGMTAGSQVPIMQNAIEASKGKAKIVQFTDVQLVVEALKIKRVSVMTADGTSMNALVKSVGGFEISRVDNGQPIRGSGGAFRKEDADFREAFVAAHRELKQSGEVEKILKQFNLEYDAKMMDISGDQACALK